MSGRPTSASGTRSGIDTATPLNPFGLEGGGRASSELDARDPLADSLAKAQSLLGRYADRSGESGARPASARPGTARPGSARPASARPTSARPGSSRGGSAPSSSNGRSEVMAFDNGAGDSFKSEFSVDADADDTYGDDDEFEETHHIYSDRSGNLEEHETDVMTFNDDNTGELDGHTGTSFSVDVDEVVDDVSVSFGNDAGVRGDEELGFENTDDELEISYGDVAAEGALENSMPWYGAAADEGEFENSLQSPPQSPPRTFASWGDVAGVRPGTAVGTRPGTATGIRPGKTAVGTRPRSAKGGSRDEGYGTGSRDTIDHGFSRSQTASAASYGQMSSTVRRGSRGPFGGPTGSLGDTQAAPWSGALSDAGSVPDEIITDDDSDADAEIVYDEAVDDDEDFELDASSSDAKSPRLRSPLLATPRSVSPPQSPRSPRLGLAPLRVSPISLPKSQRSFASPQSPAAIEAEDATEQLHRTLSGNHPMRAFGLEQAGKRSGTTPPPKSPKRDPPLVSPNKGFGSGRDLLSLMQDRLKGVVPVAQVQDRIKDQVPELHDRLNVVPVPVAQVFVPQPDSGYVSSSDADEVATEGELTPAMVRGNSRNESPVYKSPTRGGFPSPSHLAGASQSPGPRINSPSPSQTFQERSFANTQSRVLPDLKKSPKKDVTPDEMFLLNALKAARNRSPLDTRARRLLGEAGVFATETATHVGVDAKLEEAKREAAIDTHAAFAYVATGSLARNAETYESEAPAFSTAKAEAEAVRVAREPNGSRMMDLHESCQVSGDATTSGGDVQKDTKDQWWSYLNGSGSFPVLSTRSALHESGAGYPRDTDRNATDPKRPSGALLDLSPELAWASAMRARSFDGAMHARVASMRVRLRAAVANTETTRLVSAAYVSAGLGVGGG